MGRGVRASEGFSLAESSAISLKRAGAKRFSGVLGADLSTAADGACDGPADAVDKSCAAPQAVGRARGVLLLAGVRAAICLIVFVTVTSADSLRSFVVLWVAK